ncbi:hypothetical protein JE393_004955, partial [Salmonella enterica]|nr:hypothetical protein [Salmonella enterica]
GLYTGQPTFAAYNHFCGDIDCMRDLDRLLSVPGFELATSKPIVDNIDEAIGIIQRLTDEGRLTIATYEVPTAPTGSKFQGKGVLFTGIRDAQLETQIIAEGGEIKSGISSAVHILVCKDVNTSSGKAKKAREMGIEIIDVLELRRRLL